MTVQMATLPDRGILEVSGADRIAFLQGLVSNDMRLVAPNRALFSALLTAQGKLLHDFFVIAGPGDVVWLEVASDRLADLHRRLRMYKLRSKVDLQPRDDLTVRALWGDGVETVLTLPDEPGAAVAWGGGVAFLDPRLASMGARVVTPDQEDTSRFETMGGKAVETSTYETHRHAQGVPDGVRDGVVEKSTLLELGYDDLNAISWDKGCYMGQELTARTRYRGLLKRRLLPVDVEGPLPEIGTPITRGDRTVGEIRTGSGSRAIAHLRLDALASDDDPPLEAASRRVAVRTVPWLTGLEQRLG